MDDNKIPPTPDFSNDAPLPRPGGGQVMDIQPSKPFSPSDSAPILPVSDAAETSSEPTLKETPVADEAESEGSETPLATEPEQEPVNTAEPIAENHPFSNPTEAEPADNKAKSGDDSPAGQTAEASATSSAADGAAGDNPLAIPPQPAKKGSKPMAVVILAVIIALGLAGLVIFTFMKNKTNTVGTNKTAGSTTQTAAKPAASPADVDNTSKAIDTGLSKVDDSKDFSATDLSDKSLGL